MTTTNPLRVGVGGPVGSGKTALMDALCKHFRDTYEIAAITNDKITAGPATLAAWTPLMLKMPDPIITPRPSTTRSRRSWSSRGHRCLRARQPCRTRASISIAAR